MYQAAEDIPNGSSLESGPGTLVRCSSAALLSRPKSPATGADGIVPLRVPYHIVESGTSVFFHDQQV